MSYEAFKPGFQFLLGLLFNVCLSFCNLSYHIVSVIMLLPGTVKFNSFL